MPQAGNILKQSVAVLSEVLSQISCWKSTWGQCDLLQHRQVVTRPGDTLHHHTGNTLVVYYYAAADRPSLQLCTTAEDALCSSSALALPQQQVVRAVNL